jgi:hypothetical protein
MNFQELAKLYSTGKINSYPEGKIRPRHLYIFRDWEEIKVVKHWYRSGKPLKYIKKRYPNYEGFIEYEDEVLRERGGVNTAS